jgi:hypothetical protein
MLAVMKRGTLATVLFFILALFSASGPNAARFSKAMGALVIAGIFLSTAGQGSISALDSFFKANWATGDTTQGDTSANSALGTQTSTGAASLGTEVEQAAGVPGNVISETIDGVKHVYVDVNGLGQNILKSLGL